MKNDLLEGLPEEKVNLIRKYRLEPRQVGGKTYWVRNFRNRPLHPYVTHRGMRKCPTLDLVFSFYGLCVAKMTYFRSNMEDYLPCKLNYVTGQVEECAEWDMEFLVQRATGIRIDLRNLAEISDIEVFREMCRWLERRLEERREMQDRYSRMRHIGDPPPTPDISCRLTTTRAAARSRSKRRRML